MQSINAAAAACLDCPRNLPSGARNDDDARVSIVSGDAYLG
jgi:hypothetical protein